MAKGKILALNNISAKAHEILDNDYDFSGEVTNPDAIIVRSYKMHDYTTTDSLLAVARAGAGTNNIPVEDYAKKGIVVFNTPGANANAVKELVLFSMLACGRKLVQGVNWVSSLTEEGPALDKLVEGGKKNFVGNELFGKTLGVIGLGAIGALVANVGISLGMRVIGYDPALSVESAWRLDRHIKQAESVSALVAKCDFVTLHVPFIEATKNMINAEVLKTAKPGVSIINLSRGGLVNNADILSGIASGVVNRYVTDFPSAELRNCDGVICLPHLGASTPEAEDNCAVMAANQIADFLENGNIVNSVNFPKCTASRDGECRITIVHKNEKNILSGLTDVISKTGNNIENLISKSRGETAYTIFDLESKIDDSILAELASVSGVIRVRLI